MAEKRRISPDLRAAALADLHAGEQPAIVAERYGIDRETVKSWKRRYIATEDAPMHPPVARLVRPTVDAQKAHIGETILDLLRAKLKASQAIAEAVSDPDWLVRQRAAALAALGLWLDGTAFAIGDRLAGGGGRSDPGPDDSAPDVPGG
jgi:transposase-like protein